jgi:hypothetical protein
VAFLSVVAKSALLYPIAECIGQLKWEHFQKQKRPLSHMEALDSASRGPWGSFLLLWKTRGTAKFASIGAIVTILLLGFEPFAQQIIQFSTQKSEIDDQGRITKSNAWSDDFWIGLFRQGGSRLTEFATFPLSMALQNTAADHPLALPINAYCPNQGECTVDGYDSLAVCSTCEVEEFTNESFDNCTYNILLPGDQEDRENITSLAEFQAILRELNDAKTFDTGTSRISILCEKWFDNDFPPVSLEVGSNGPDGADLTHNEASIHVGDLMWRTETGNNQSIRGLQNSSSFIQSCNKQLGSFTQSDAIETITDRFKVNATEVAAYTCLNSTTDMTTWKDLTNWGKLSATISRCKLDFCAKKYENVILQAGSIQVGKITDIPLIQESGKPSEFQLGKLNNVSFNEQLIADDNSITSKYRVGQNSRQWLHDQIGAAMDDLSFLTTINLQIVRDSPPGNWTHRFEKIAAAITNLVQSKENPNSTDITTSVSKEEIFVVVRWPWFILPLTTVLVTFLFLALTIAKSRSQPYLFKTSIMAVLFHGLEGWDLSGAQAAGRSATGMGEGGARKRVVDDELVERSKMMIARLEENDKGSLKLKRD